MKEIGTNTGFLLRRLGFMSSVKPKVKVDFFLSYVCECDFHEYNLMYPTNILFFNPNHDLLLNLTKQCFVKT